MSKIFCAGIFLKVLLITCVLSFGFVQAKKRTRNIPLLNNVKSPLFAEFDFSSVNKELENFITENVEYQVNDSCIDKIEQEVKEKQKDLKTAILQVYSDEIIKLKNENANMLSSHKNDLTLKFDEMKQDISRDVTLRFTKMEKENAELKSSLSLLKTENAELKSSLSLVKTELMNNEPVGFTTFGTSFGTKTSGTVLKFPNIKSSFGVTQLSTFRNTGIWSCEKTGIYLLSVTIMACASGDTRFTIHRNQTEEGQFYIGRSNSGISDCNSGTGTIVLRLSSADTLHVKTLGSMTLYDLWSIFTIVKIQ